jgi:hypothetical protein
MCPAPGAAKRPLVLAAKPRYPRASPDWLHDVPTNEPGASRPAINHDRPNPLPERLSDL